MAKKNRPFRALTLLLIALLLGLLIWGIVLVFGEEETAGTYRSLAGQRQAVSEYRESVGMPEFTPDPITSEPTAPTGPTEPEELTDLWREFQAYNTRISAEGQTHLEDPFAETAEVFNLEDFGLADDVFGVLSIPKMELDFPIYLGATTQHLNDGAAQLTETSVPIGGESTNAVLAIHRQYIMDVECLEEGDLLYIQNPWETLNYKISEIRLIWPSEREEIKISPGKDQISIMTCHPWGSGGRYRYLVTADRAEVTEEDITANHPEKTIDRIKRQWENEGAKNIQTEEGMEYVPSQRDVLLKTLLPKLCVAVIALLVFVVLLWVISEIRRRRKKKQ